MFEIIDISSGAVVIIFVVVVVIFRGRITDSLDKRYFTRRWAKLTKLCVDRKLWYQAIIDADELLDEALKQRHFKGKTTGERLVSAQHYFSSNDTVWFSHKLKNKITEQDHKKLNKKETLEALASFKLALKDLGALSSDRRTKAKS
ncbi:MAG TPA: hypothetical protein VGF75_03420 [Candidatus Saccharimonadales bacterium]